MTAAPRQRALKAASKSAPSVRIRRRVPLPVQRVAEASATIVTFDGLDEPDHVALVFGDVAPDSAPWVRVHSSCITGDVFGSMRCDCGPQLDQAIAQFEREGGVLLYLMQEGRGIGLAAKIDAYALQDAGMDTFQANRYLGHRADARDYAAAAQMLRALGLERIRLLTGNPNKITQLAEHGVTVAEHRPIRVEPNPHNARYLAAKESRFAELMRSVEGAAPG
jgi:GTP cyclohydrolase II